MQEPRNLPVLLSRKTNRQSPAGDIIACDPPPQKSLFFCKDSRTLMHILGEAREVFEYHLSSLCTPPSWSWHSSGNDIVPTSCRKESSYRPLLRG